MIKMTQELAHAAGWDAANRLMRKKRLDAWDDECARVAVETFHRVYGHDLLVSIYGHCPECQDKRQ
jgi:hypothetical protein